MDRVKVPSGSIQKLETVFDDTQTLVHGNLNKRIDAITGIYGTLNALINDVQNSASTGLKLSITNVNTQTMTIQPGVALLADGSIILLESAYTFELSDAYTDTIAINTYYQIHLKYKEVGTDPIVAQNAFFFDRAGLTPYSERFSRWSDSFEVVAYVRTPSVDITVPTDEIPIAIVKVATVATKLTDGSYTFQDINELRSSTDNVIDIRKDYTFRLNHNVLDDQLILFKDRNSTGSNKVNGSVEFDGLLSNTLTISGVSSLSETDITGVLTVNSTSNSTSSWINIKSGYLNTAALIFKDDIRDRGYVAFDTNLKYAIGFVDPIPTPDDIDVLPTGQRFVVTNSAYIGNHYNPTVELDLKNLSTSADGTTIKLSHVPATAAQSTIFNIGVEYTGGTDPSYGRGYIQPVTYNRPFEFLDYNGNYVIRLDNANRKAYLYSIEVQSTTTLSSAVMTSATIDETTTTDLFATNGSISYLTLSGLAISSADASGINLPGTAATTFRVGVGSADYPEGRLVLLADPDVNTPSNFRIYDVGPTNDRRESMSYIHFKWNWDGLNGTKQSTNQIVLNSTTTTGETLNLTSGAATIRQFYFSSSGNLYDIASYDATTRTITLTDDFTAGDIINDLYPAKIVDPNVTYYTIRCIEQDLDEGVLTKKAIIVTLDYDNIALDPEHVMKLELNKKWSISIRAGNNAHTSPYVTMLPGAYDPDHEAGGQSNNSYSSPFYNRLPYIDGASGISTPSMTLTSTAYGFKLDIEGWEGNTRDVSPHEFEVGYTTLSGITWENSSYSTTKKSGATFIRTINRTLQVSTNQSTTWTVGVRPIQNNQPVGTPVLGIVQSGGGGIVPQDSIVVGPFEFNITVASGIILQSGVYTDQYIISGFNNELWGENVLAGSVIYTGSEETTILSNTLRFTEA